jgi:hypothetical protein
MKSVTLQKAVSIRRGVGFVLSLLGVSVTLGWGAAAASRSLLRESPEDWVSRCFCGTPEQSRRVRVLETSFRAECPPQCAQMCASRNTLEQVLARSRSVTPELRGALETHARACSAARLEVLEHVYAVAAVLPEERRDAYLRAVLPNLLSGCSAHGCM